MEILIKRSVQVDFVFPAYYALKKCGIDIFFRNQFLEHFGGNITGNDLQIRNSLNFKNKINFAQYQKHLEV